MSVPWIDRSSPVAERVLNGHASFSLTLMSVIYGSCFAMEGQLGYGLLVKTTAIYYGNFCWRGGSGRESGVFDVSARSIPTTTLTGADPMGRDAKISGCKPWFSSALMRVACA